MKVIDRSIVNTTRAAKAGTLYMTIPAEIARQTKLEGRADLQLVEMGDGTRGVLLTPFKVEAL